MKDKMIYDTIPDLLQGVGADQDFVEKYRKALKKRAIFYQLAILRGSLGISEKEMAKRLKCSLKKFEKRECSKNPSFKFLRKYLNALKVPVKIQMEFDPEQKYPVVKIEAKTPVKPDSLFANLS